MDLRRIFSALFFILLFLLGFVLTDMTMTAVGLTSVDIVAFAGGVRWEYTNQDNIIMYVDSNFPSAGIIQKGILVKLSIDFVDYDEGPEFKGTQNETLLFGENRLVSFVFEIPLELQFRIQYSGGVSFIPTFVFSLIIAGAEVPGSGRIVELLPQYVTQGDN